MKSVVKNSLLIIVLIFLIAGCSVSTSVETESQSISLKEAEAVKIELQMGAGKLNLTGGADNENLVEAAFSYNQPELKPVVDYNVSNKEGHLTIKNKNISNISLKNIENSWSLRLNDDVKKELHVTLGAGEGTLKLGSLNVTFLDLKLGAGEVTLDFTGDWNQQSEASIKGGVGETTLLLPKDVGVKVKAVGGLGKINTNGIKVDGDYFVNDAYGKSDVNLYIDVKGGVGVINLKVE